MASRAAFVRRSQKWLRKYSQRTNGDVDHSLAHAEKVTGGAPPANRCPRAPVFVSTSGSRISTSGNRRALNFGEISENSKDFSDFSKNLKIFRNDKMKLSQTSKNDGLSQAFWGREGHRAKCVPVSYNYLTLATIHLG